MHIVFYGILSARGGGGGSNVTMVKVWLRVCIGFILFLLSPIFSSSNYSPKLEIDTLHESRKLCFIE